MASGLAHYGGRRVCGRKRIAYLRRGQIRGEKEIRSRQNIRCDMRSFAYRVRVFASLSRVPLKRTTLSPCGLLTAS